MTESSGVSHHAERMVVGTEAGDVPMVQKHLRALSELSLDGMADTEFDAVQADATDLADRLASYEGVDLPEPLKSEVWAVARRACRCILAADGIDEGELPTVKAVAEEGVAAAERLAERRAKIEAETMVIAALAETAAAERTEALAALRSVAEMMTERSTKSEWLENVADLEGAFEQERKSRERKQEINEGLSEIREELDM